MSLMSESGLLFDQMHQSFGISEDFWLAIDSAMMQKGTGGLVKTHQ